jgi:dodecin
LASEADAAWWPALAAAPAMDAVTATGLVARDEAPASSVHVASTFSQRSSSLNRINMCATHAFLHQQAESPSHDRMDRRRGDQFLLLRATHRRTSALRKPSFVRLVFIPQDDPSRRAVATRYVRHRQRRAPQFVKITWDSCACAIRNQVGMREWAEYQRGTSVAQASWQLTVKTREDAAMSVARVVEISSTSEKSFEDAIVQGIARASKTLRQIRSAWVKEQEVTIKDGKIVAYKVNLKVTFVLDDTVA